MMKSASATLRGRERGNTRLTLCALDNDNRVMECDLSWRWVCTCTVRTIIQIQTTSSWDVYRIDTLYIYPNNVTLNWAKLWFSLVTPDWNLSLRMPRLWRVLCYIPTKCRTFDAFSVRLNAIMHNLTKQKMYLKSTQYPSSYSPQIDQYICDV